MKINSKTPFTTRTQVAAQGIHGSFDQRNMSINGPLKQHDGTSEIHTVPGIDANALATSLLGSPSTGVGQNFKKDSDEIIKNPNLATVSADVQNSKTLENPAAVTEPEYSFLDNTGSGLTDYSANLKNDPNRNNFFGTPKRTEGSFEERINQATADGKYNKVKRLTDRRDNFRANNLANKPS